MLSLFRFIVKTLNLEWWVYLVAVAAFFVTAVTLNYVVKKINEARLDERLVRIQNKASNTQSVQAQRPAESKLPQKAPLEIVLEQSNPSTVKGVSLVYENNDNANDLNKDKINIMNFPNSKSLPKINATDENAAEKDETEKTSEIEIIPPAFLGKIYKELSAVEKSKSMSNAEKVNAKDEIDDILEFKKPESKSAPSVKKLLDNQNKEGLPVILVDNVSELKPTTSEVILRK